MSIKYDSPLKKLHIESILSLHCRLNPFSLSLQESEEAIMARMHLLDMQIANMKQVDRCFE